MVKEKSLGEILNETFALMGKEFKSYCGITLLVFVPFNLILMLLNPKIIMSDYSGGMISQFDAISYFLVALLTLFAITFSFSLVSVATGQQVAFNRISIKLCFERVTWRLYSLLFVNLLIVIGVLVAIVGLVLVLPAVAALFFLIFSSLSLPVILFEGYKYISAIKRSFQLVKTSWGRVAVGMILVTLLIIGGSILISLPMLLVSSTSIEMDQGGTWITVSQYALGVIANSFTTAVAGIAITLIYIDLRARAGDLQLDRLRFEIGDMVSSNNLQDGGSKKSISIVSSE